jgi:hypothetical protein
LGQQLQGIGQHIPAIETQEYQPVCTFCHDPGDISTIMLLAIGSRSDDDGSLIHRIIRKIPPGSGSWPLRILVAFNVGIYMQVTNIASQMRHFCAQPHEALQLLIGRLSR